MPTVAIMNLIVDELDAAFSDLKIDHDVYLSPTVIEVPGRRVLDIQVCDGGVRYTDFEGGVRREFFTITIGILKEFKVDTTNRYVRALQHVTKSLFVDKETIITTLEGSFLTTNLVRPLRVVAETAIRRGREAGVLIKEIDFLGGLNVAR